MNTVMILLDRRADNPSLMTECGHADENLSPDRPGTLERKHGESYGSTVGQIEYLRTAWVIRID
jgi:hypothetical protein